MLFERHSAPYARVLRRPTRDIPAKTWPSAAGTPKTLSQPVIIVQAPSPMTPEQQARAEIDQLLTAAGWVVQPRDKVDLTASRGIAICEFPLKKATSLPTTLLYVDCAAVGVVEAKRAGIPLTGVRNPDRQILRRTPDQIPLRAARSPSSTKAPKRRNPLHQPPRTGRPAAAPRLRLHNKPETFLNWINGRNALPAPPSAQPPHHAPTLPDASPWPAQKRAILNLEKSLAENRPRALIQMATRQAERPSPPAISPTG